MSTIDTLWTHTTLGAVCQINPPKPKYNGLVDDTPVLFVPMAAVDDVSGEVASPQHRTLGEVRSKSYRTFASKDVIFAKITPCMENGKSAIVPEIPSGLGFGSTEFHVLRPNEGVNTRFIWHYIRQASFRRVAQEHMTGSVGQARVPAAFLQDFPIELPPQAIQDEIVRVLDAATTSGESARGHLDAARQTIQRFRRIATTAAASGRLTAAWRLEQGVLDVDGSPSTWTEASIEDVAESLDSQRKPVNASDRAKRVGNIPYYGANGQVGWIDRALFNETLVLVVEDETFTGRQKPFSYMISGPSWVNNHAHVLRPRPNIIPEMLNILLSYYDFVPLTSGTTGRRKLTKAVLMSAKLHLPPEDEQAEIVGRVNRVNTTADRLLAHIDSASRGVEKSSQAILTKAFRGELTLTAAKQEAAEVTR